MSDKPKCDCLNECGDDSDLCNVMMTECEHCNGTGECPSCNGTGFDDGEICPACFGSGECPECGGAGEYEESSDDR